MQRFPPRRPRHDARPLIGTARHETVAILVVVSAMMGMACTLFDPVHAQPADATGDPFAGELHPLRRAAGDLPEPTPLPVAPARPPAPAGQLPVPFPEAEGAVSESPSQAEPADDAETYLQQACEARRRGDLEGSVEWCSRGLSNIPDHPELLLRRGIAWFHLGMHGIAAEDFADAAAIAFDDPRPELWRGLTSIERGRPLEAVSAYSEAIRRDRTFRLAYLNRGLAYLQAGEPAKAERDFDHAIRHDPRDVEAWFCRGVATARQQRWSAALRSYETALRVDPGHEPSRRNLEAIQKRGAISPRGGAPSAASSW